MEMDGCTIKEVKKKKDGAQIKHKTFINSWSQGVKNKTVV